mgnify:CR=1 FL=1
MTRAPSATSTLLGAQLLLRSKRAAENLCVSYHSEYQVPVKAVRLAQTFGPGIPRDDVRLFAALARNAVAGKDFVMKTTGESTRMYSYTADAVSAILTVLVAGENGVSYNVANPSTYSSIREMADMVYREFGTGDAHVIIDVDRTRPTRRSTTCHSTCHALRRSAGGRR